MTKLNILEAKIRSIEEESIKTRLRFLMEKSPYRLAIFDDCSGFARKLISIYGREECHDHELYCILISSTPNPKIVLKFDFENREHSIIEFMENLEKKYSVESLRVKDEIKDSIWALFDEELVS